MTSPLSYWTWSPEFHFPWSGGVTQHIEPDLTWFSNWITPGAGDAAIEQKVFTKVASYGTQLGLITDVLLALVDQSKLSAEKDSIVELRRIKALIDEIKAVEHKVDNNLIAAQVGEVQKRGGAQLRELETMLLPLLKETQLENQRQASE
jgi:hypothetical protein